jgi:AcrR family transcriptional regulator
VPQPKDIPARPAETSPFPTREQRSQEREEKREAVLRAAVRMFNARGFHATSLDDVAASLGISKPTIYYYLGNKEEVLLECLRRGVQLLRAAADEAHAEPGPGLDRLRGFLRRYAGIMMDDFGRVVIRTGDEALSDERAEQFRGLKAEVDQAMRTLLAEGIADGSIAPLDIKLTAFTIAGALNWPARWHDPEGPLTPQEIAAAMVDILTGGIAPRRAG